MIGIYNPRGAMKPSKNGSVHTGGVSQTGAQQWQAFIRLPYKVQQHVRSHCSDFPARRSAVSSKTKKTMVHFSNEYGIRFYEHPNKVHASELHYSRDAMQFKLANRQAILDMHMRRLSLANGSTDDDAKSLQA